MYIQLTRPAVWLRRQLFFFGIVPPTPPPPPTRQLDTGPPKTPQPSAALLGWAQSIFFV